MIPIIMRVVTQIALDQRQRHRSIPVQCNLKYCGKGVSCSGLQKKPTSVTHTISLQPEHFGPDTSPVFSIDPSEAGGAGC